MSVGAATPSSCLPLRPAVNDIKSRTACEKYIWDYISCLLWGTTVGVNLIEVEFMQCRRPFMSTGKHASRSVECRPLLEQSVYIRMLWKESRWTERINERMNLKHFGGLLATICRPGKVMFARSTFRFVYTKNSYDFRQLRTMVWIPLTKTGFSHKSLCLPQFSLQIFKEVQRLMS